jgi:hypothetical protein
MKKIFNFQQVRRAIILVFVAASLVQLTRCKEKDPEPSEEEIVKEKLTSGTWTLQSVTVDNVDQTAVYQGLTINFTETTYTTTKGGQVWPASGTWSFIDDTAIAIKRDDGTEVKVEATDTSLKLTLTWSKTTLAPGRIESVKGLHVFTFKKN